MSCQCPQPGWCERHACHKTAHWWNLCRLREDYFELWEQGRGPGQKRESELRPPLRERCRHRGPDIRQEICLGCGGDVRIKIFFCSVHGECTLGQPLAGIACCSKCDDYLPAEAGSPTEN